MSQLDGVVHGSSARARENSVLLEIDRVAFDALYQASDATAAKIQRAIHKSLLQSLRRTNNHLSRLISQGLIRGRGGSVPVKELQSALYGQCAIPVADARSAADDFG
jgi:CRP-like cAMP-binding protein